jgi:hypothetical protein
VDRAAAVFAQQAGFLLVGRWVPFEFVFGAMAAFTQHEGLAFFDPNHRNEEDLKIMIDAFVISLLQAANRTPPGIFVQNLRFWAYTEDKEHYSGSRVQGSKIHPPLAAPKAVRVQGCDLLCIPYYNPESNIFANFN